MSRRGSSRELSQRDVASMDKRLKEKRDAAAKEGSMLSKKRRERSTQKTEAAFQREMTTQANKEKRTAGAIRMLELDAEAAELMYTEDELSVAKDFLREKQMKENEESIGNIESHIESGDQKRKVDGLNNLAAELRVLNREAALGDNANKAAVQGSVRELQSQVSSLLNEGYTILNGEERQYLEAIEGHLETSGVEDPAYVQWYGEVVNHLINKINQQESGQ